MPRYHCEGWIKITIPVDCHEYANDKDEAYRLILSRYENMVEGDVNNSDIEVKETHESDN
jgi:hypothetical protein